MIDGRRIHRPQHAIGYVSRPGNLKKMASALNSHYSSLDAARDLAGESDDIGAAA
jgi:hypothetical protein